MTDTRTRSYIDSTHLYLGVEAVLTDEEKKRFLAAVVDHNPQLQGAHVADVIDMMNNADAYLEITEPMYEEYADEIHAWGIPGLFSLCCYLAIYLHPDDKDDHAKTWAHVEQYVARWQAARCGHVWFEAPQPEEEGIRKCLDCGEALHQVPGGDGPVWVNREGYAACLAGSSPQPHHPDSRVVRRCTLDKDHTFPIDHHDRRAPNF